MTSHCLFSFYFYLIELLNLIFVCLFSLSLKTLKTKLEMKRYFVLFPVQFWILYYKQIKKEERERNIFSKKFIYEWEPKRMSLFFSFSVSADVYFYMYIDRSIESRGIVSVFFPWSKHQITTDQNNNNNNENNLFSF